MNRLSESLSPYLLQHQNNPVDWYPWGDEAFELAKQTDRPIFLSVGYAACHWCHVMEHESFENTAIAAYLNEHFVSVKVDREERPDIDQIYMNAVQVMTGRGGWPMSVFLDHDRQPFYAGTYWPPENRHGMPGFPQVLDAINDAWTHRRAEVTEHSAEITAALTQLAAGATADQDADSDTVIERAIVDQATDHLLRVLDRHEGGFGAAPKFPHATDLLLLLQRAAVTGDQELTRAAVFTLDKMAAGGIRDHVGGGFARYSVDAQWLVPHFEKMLYDNALLAQTYLRAYQVTGETRHAEVADEILRYLCRDMKDSAGGFHCSEDADSEGVEGKFYVWKPEQVAAVLGDENAQLVCKHYDITAAGNFEGNSIPRLKQPIESEALKTQLQGHLETLRTAREKDRVRPGRDDKILVAWNALAIGAFARGAVVLGRTDYLQAAIDAAQFVIDKMTKPDGRLLHAYRQGQAHLDAYLDDYAFFVESCIALFESTGNPDWIQTATGLADTMLEHFLDPTSGGFFYTADDAEVLITRNKDWHDGSLVSGNAAAASGLWQLAELTSRQDYRDAAIATLVAGGEVLRTQSAACAALVSVLDRYHTPARQWVIAVPSSDDVQTIASEVFTRFDPTRIVSWVVGDSVEKADLIPLNRDRPPIGGKPTCYACQDFVCSQPIVGHEMIAIANQKQQTDPTH